MLSIDKRRNIAQQNREKVLDAAITLFQEKGFDNVSIDEIGKAAGFSRGTLYKLFVSKEDIVATYMARWNALYAAYYHEELENTGLDALEKFLRLTYYMLKASTQGGQALQRVAIASAMRDRLLAEKVSKTGEEVDEILVRLLEEGVEEGTVTCRYPVEDMLNMTYTVVEGTALRWASLYDDSSLDDTADSMLAMLDGLFRKK